MRVPEHIEGAINKGLGAAESLKVGTGKLDLGAFADYQRGKAMVGGYADYQKRISDKVAAFARAEGGYQFGQQDSSAFARAVTGLRFRF